MQFPQYQDLAKKTEAVPAALIMNQVGLHAILEIAIASTKIADMVKRKLYYGRDIEAPKMLEQLQFMYGLIGFVGSAIQADPNLINVPMSPEELANADLPDAARGIDLNNLNVRLLHSVIGTFTEAGEKLEALKAQFEGGALDIVNMAEEFGDDNWYDAIGKDELTVLGAAQGKLINDATIRAGNITKLQGNEKLKGRYNSGDFDAVAALNRDLASERAILEQSVNLSKAA